jgi:hypothetical protein
MNYDLGFLRNPTLKAGFEKIFDQEGVKVGKIYHVDPANGRAGNDGFGWETACLTMAAAFAKLESGDTIYFKGKVIEQISTPVEVFDVTIIGVGNRPRHIDGTAKAGSESTAMWTTPAVPVTTTPLCTVRQQGWRFINILFAGPSAKSCVQLFRDAGEGDAERDGSHAEFYNCRFASGMDGIEQSGGCGHVGVYGCFFTSLTGFAIRSTGGAGVGYPIRWELISNRFLDNVNCVKIPAIGWNVIDNSFMTTTTEVLDLTNADAAAANNVVVGNRFNILAADFDPTGKVRGSATDVWSNYLLDTIETGVPAD